MYTIGTPLLCVAETRLRFVSAEFKLLGLHPMGIISEVTRFFAPEKSFDIRYFCNVGITD